MTKLKTILLLLMFAMAAYLAFSHSSFKNNTIYESRQDIQEKEDVILIQNHPLWQDEKTDLYEITYDLSGIYEENAKNDIDRWVSDRVFQFKNSAGFESYTEEDKEFLGFNSGMRYTLDFSYYIKESEKIKTYVLKSAVFTGGAHGNLEVITFNYDKDTGVRLNLSDLFVKTPGEYLAVLGALGDKFLYSTYGEDAFYDGLKPQPENWATWYTIDDKIVFIFQLYQVVPYAYGMPEFEVSVFGISDLVNKKYFPNLNNTN